jgi:hypothetical protein
VALEASRSGASMFGWLRPRPDLEERLEKLERALRDIQVDWDQTYEKFRILNLRLAKRVKREEQATSEGDENGHRPMSIQEQILWEREGGR